MSKIDDILHDEEQYNEERHDDEDNDVDENKDNPINRDENNIVSDMGSEIESQATTLQRSNRARDAPEHINIETTRGQTYLQLEREHNLFMQG